MVVELEVIPKTLLELERRYQIQSLAYGAKLPICTEFYRMDVSLDSCTPPPITFFTPSTFCSLVRQPLVCSFYASVGKTLALKTSLVE